tara:strand:+ start:219 stop:608 length:390 start_codon:yes stop_codon:yes gene_type:complete
MSAELNENESKREANKATVDSQSEANPYIQPDEELGNSKKYKIGIIVNKLFTILSFVLPIVVLIIKSGTFTIIGIMMLLIRCFIFGATKRLDKKVVNGEISFEYWDKWTNAEWYCGLIIPIVSLILLFN